MNPQEGRRVVSKTRYLCYMIHKTTLNGTGTALMLLGVIGIGVSVNVLMVNIYKSWGTNISPEESVWSVPMILISLLMGSLSVLVFRSGIRQLNKIDHLEPLVPLTRQNAEQLPAEQSLVRASSEPEQLQHAVLLRAAGSDTHAPAQELLRATTQEETPPISIRDGQA